MTVTRKVKDLPSLGNLQEGDVVLGERTAGTTGLFTVPALSGGGGGAVDSVNGQTGIVVLDADDIDDTSTTNKFVSSADLILLGNTSGTNTGDNATNSQYSGLATSKQDVITGLTASGAELNILDGATLTTTELNYVDGVTSAIQTQLDGKAPSLGADDNYVTDAEKTKLSNLSGTNTGDQSVFTKIAVSGQSDIDADSTTDTLTLAAGSNITITTNAGTDTITIAASGGSDGYTSTATAAGTTTLTSGSTSLQVFTGSTTQNCDLPAVNTLSVGTKFIVLNTSTGIVTTRSSGGNTVMAMEPGTRLEVVSNTTSGTSAAVWTIKNYGLANNYYTGTSNKITVSPVGAISIANNPVFGGSDGMVIPQGSSGSEPSSPSEGTLRWNISTGQLRLGSGSTWYNILTDFFVTGSGNAVRATSPTLVTPLLGTPTSGTLTNCSSNCKVLVYRSTTQSVSNSTVTTVLWDGEYFDTNALHSTSSNTGRLTAPVTGLYAITGVVVFAANATGVRQIIINSSGSSPDQAVIFPNQGGASETQVFIATYMYLTASDYVELQVWQNSGGSLAVNTGVGSSIFGMALVI